MRSDGDYKIGLLSPKEGMIGDTKGIFYRGRYYIACKYPEGWKYTEMEVLKSSTHSKLVNASNYDTIHRAFNELRSGDTLYLPASTYDLNGQPITITVNNISIIGDGFTSKITNTGTKCDCFQIGQTGTDTSLDNMTFADFMIDGGISNLIDRAFELFGNKYSIYKGLYIYRCDGEAFRFDHTTGGSPEYSKENQIDHCLIRDCGQDTTSSSIVFNVCDNNYFSNCQILGGGSTTRNIYAIQSDGVRFNGCTFSGCSGHMFDINTNTYGFVISNSSIGGANKHGVYINGCRNVTLIGNRIHWNSKSSATTYDCISIEGTTERTIIANNLIYATKEPDDGLTAYGRYGVYLNSADITHSMITNNFIFGFNNDGIRINGGDYNNILGNEIYDNDNGLVLLAGSVSNHCVDNNIYNNTTANVSDAGTTTTLDNWEDG